MAGNLGAHPQPLLPLTLNELNGSLRVGYITDLGNGHLLLAALWVDRQTYPGQPLFNDETEGCLPMEVVLADSHDLGHTWSDWRVVPVPPDVGPPSLTNPVLVLPSGRLALSIETNKTYLDRGQWLQRVVYLYSEDKGQTWGDPVTTCQDPTGRIFNWDQRAGVCPDGRVVTFTWTYDRQTTQYLNIQRHLSADGGATWSAPDDLGFPDQAAHPAILPDGHVVLAWVDRFQSHSIRARLAPAADAPFTADTEVELYRQTAASSQTAAGQGDTGDLLAEMGLWSFGSALCRGPARRRRHGRLLRWRRRLHGSVLGSFVSIKEDASRCSNHPTRAPIYSTSTPTSTIPTSWAAPAIQWWRRRIWTASLPRACNALRCTARRRYAWPRAWPCWQDATPATSKCGPTIRSSIRGCRRWPTPWERPDTDRC